MSISNNELILLMTNETSLHNAKVLADKILKERLAACVNFSFIESLYWWNNRLEECKEVQILMKTNYQSVHKLIDFIEANHSYETPEVIYWKVSSGKDYFSYVNQNLQL